MLCAGKKRPSIALLTPLGYILVLFAMRLAPISHVAPLREMSMLVGMYFGARFLSEGQIVRRIIGVGLDCRRRGGAGAGLTEPYRLFYLRLTEVS